MEESLLEISHWQSGSRIIAHTVHELRCRGGEYAGESAYIEGGQCITLDIWNSD